MPSKVLACYLVTGTFVAIDETRMTGEGLELQRSGNLGAYFDDSFAVFVELMQRDHTFRRLGREVGSPSLFSRLDRVYIGVHPTALEDVSITVSVRGNLDRVTVASDHRAVEAYFRTKVPGRTCLQPYAITNGRFGKLFAEEFEPNAHVTDPSARYASVVQAAHKAHARIRQAPGVGRSPTPHQVVDVALRVYRMCREGRPGDAVNLASEFERTREAVRGGVLDKAVLGKILQESRWTSVLCRTLLLWKRPKSPSSSRQQSVSV